MHDPDTTGTTLPSATSMDPVTWLWLGVAFLFAVVGCTFNSSRLVLGAGFFAKALAVLVGTGTGFAGALLGDAIRKFAKPDAIFTSGGVLQILWAKLFWAIGPQVIGLGIGVAFGCSLILKWLA